ncbi:MAG: hypothetical protein V1744_03325 [Candidatus Altiarchaeota archaeon]
MALAKSRLLIVVGFLLAAAGLWYILDGFKYRMMFAALPFLFALQITLSDAMEDMLTSRTGYRTRWFTLLIAPGTILHEMCHLVAALATGCTITKAALFKPNPATGVLGFVSYTQPDDKWVVFREFIVGLAPFFGCGLLLLPLNILYGGSLLSLVSDAPISDLSSASDFTSSVASAMISFFTNLNYSKPGIIILVYLQLCFTVGAVPSSVDIKGAISSLWKHLFSSIFFIAFVTALVLMSQKQLDMWGYEGGVASAIGSALKFTTMILLLSITLLAFMLPTTYFTFKALDIDGIAKTIPFTSAFLAFYFLKEDYGVEYLLPSVAALFLLTLIILLFFAKPKSQEKKAKLE